MIKLLKNANVYVPDPLGNKDILIAGEKICRIQEDLSIYENLPDVKVYDLEGRYVIPGYIDLHVHITGGGGEKGPASRVPESQLSTFLMSGITTVVGLLGTDGITRSVENLVAKARALTEEGITAYALTSFYGYPPSTITESVEKDIVMIPPIIGVKTAASDHRSSNITGEELIRLATSARRAGLLSGAPGLVTIHMGNGKKGLEPIFYALDHSDLPPDKLLPTHMHRNHELAEQGAKLVRRGGYIDFTAGCDDDELLKNAETVLYTLDQPGVELDHITLSSDAYGSQPRFDANGKCVGLTYASPKFLHKTVQILVKKGLPLERSIRLLTTTPAYLLGKTGIKGCIAVNADADLLVLDDRLEIDGLFAKGQEALWKKRLKMKGTFE